MENIYLKKLKSYQDKVFENVYEFKKQLRKDFKTKKIELIKNENIDDEYCLIAPDDYIYSFYVFRGNSHRIMVIEINRDID